MAENLFILKRRIKTATNITQIAKAMEMISASKIKKAQNMVENNKPYAQKISFLTQNIIAKTDLKDFTHLYINPQKTDKKLLIVLSPDKGLCGSLNTNLAKKLFELESRNTSLVTVGKKMERYVTRLNYDFVAAFTIGSNIPSYTLVFQLKKLINQYYLSGLVSEVVFLYTEFESIFIQFPKTITVLPIQKSEETTKDFSALNANFLVEPGVYALLEALLPYYIETQIYSCLIESYTSEHAARMVAMQNAKNNARDVAAYLTLRYNKTRQERITSELLDLNNSQIV